VQSLVELAYSVREDVQCPGHERGRGSVIAEIPKILFCYIYFTTIRGTRLFVMHGTDRAGERNGLYVFDSSRGGSAALPLSDLDIEWG